jgi:hypothetical protein
MQSLRPQNESDRPTLYERKCHERQAKVGSVSEEHHRQATGLTLQCRYVVRNRVPCERHTPQEKSRSRRERDERRSVAQNALLTWSDWTNRGQYRFDPRYAPPNSTKLLIQNTGPMPNAEPSAPKTSGTTMCVRLFAMVRIPFASPARPVGDLL